MSGITIELLEAVAGILLRCFLMGLVLLLAWFGVLMVPGDVVHRVHGDMFGLSPHAVNLIHYCGLAFVKMCVLLFFLFPYIAIRLVLRKSKA